MKNKLHREVVGPFTGIIFEIRRVKVSEYMRELKDLPFSLAPGTTEELGKLNDALEKLTPGEQELVNTKSMNLFLSKGVVQMKYPEDEAFSRPNIWYGEDGLCPEDHVLVCDLGSDADLVAGEVAQYSFNIKGGKALEGFFREKQLEPAGPSGEEVRAETVEPVAG